MTTNMIIGMLGAFIIIWGLVSIIRKRKPIENVYLDVETTGFSPSKDEVLEVGVLDDNGYPLVDTLIQPTRRKRWPNAQRIHGITPEDVKDSPLIEDVAPSIAQAVKGKRVVIYNASFDIGFLPFVEDYAKRVDCAMNKWTGYAGKKQKLTTAAKSIGYSFKAHRAIDDCRATRAIWRHLDG